MKNVLLIFVSGAIFQFALVSKSESDVNQLSYGFLTIYDMVFVRNPEMLQVASSMIIEAI